MNPRRLTTVSEARYFRDRLIAACPGWQALTKVRPTVLFAEDPEDLNRYMAFRMSSKVEAAVLKAWQDVEAKGGIDKRLWSKTKQGWAQQKYRGQYRFEDSDYNARVRARRAEKAAAAADLAAEEAAEDAARWEAVRDHIAKYITLFDIQPGLNRPGLNHTEEQKEAAWSALAEEGHPYAVWRASGYDAALRPAPAGIVAAK